MPNSTKKEQAYLYDLYVAPDWGERFAALIDEHTKLPAEGRVLYLASGTGSHALALALRAGAGVEIIGVDETEERTALAQAKQQAADSDAGTDFRTAQLEALPFDDEAFDLVVADLSLMPAYRLPEIFIELTRVARAGGTLAVALVTASSFGEFFSLYWEALATTNDGEHAALVERFINELPTVTNAEAMLAREGLDDVQSWTNREEFEYASGAEFLDAPVVANFLLPDWLAPLPDDDTRDIAQQNLRNLIDEDHDPETKWMFSIKATLITGRRAE